MFSRRLKHRGQLRSLAFLLAFMLFCSNGLFVTNAFAAGADEDDITVVESDISVASDDSDSSGNSTEKIIKEITVLLASGGTGNIKVYYDSSTKKISRYSPYSEPTSSWTLIVPDWVSGIEMNTFMGSSKLTKVVIPGNVRTVDGSAFSNCQSLNTVYIMNGVETIGDGAFLYCKNLTCVELPTSIKSISSTAFYNSTSVVVYDTKENCSSQVRTTLTDMSDRIKPLPKDSPVVYDYAEDEEGNITITGYNGIYEDPVIPGTYAGMSDMPITDIKTVDDEGNKTFLCNGEPITSIAFQEGTVSISADAFKGYDSLTSLTIPTTVTSIGDGAFEGCMGLHVFTENTSDGVVDWILEHQNDFVFDSLPNVIRRVTLKSADESLGIVQFDTGSSYLSRKSQAVQFTATCTAQGYEFSGWTLTDSIGVELSSNLLSSGVSESSNGLLAVTDNVESSASDIVLTANFSERKTYYSISCAEDEDSDWVAWTVDGTSGCVQATEGAEVIVYLIKFHDDSEVIRSVAASEVNVSSRVDDMVADLQCYITNETSLNPSLVKLKFIMPASNVVVSTVRSQR